MLISLIGRGLFAISRCAWLLSFVFLRSSLLPLLVLSLEQLVLVVQAVQFAIEQVNFLRRLQSDTFQSLFVAGYHPCCSACELELECFAHVAVQTHYIFVLRQSFAIRRVDDYQSTIGLESFLLQFVAFQFLDADLLDVDVFLHASRTDVLHCGLYGVVACIRTVDAVCERAFVAVIFAQGFEQIFVEVFPVLERKMLAEDTGRNVQRDECRLNQQCS